MKHVMSAATLIAFVLALPLTAVAQSSAPPEKPTEKKAYNYSVWAKGLFSEVVTVTNPGKIIFMGGVGSEDEKATEGGKILYVGDFMGQCKYAWDKIKRTLEKQGSTLNDVDKVTTYITDMRYIRDALKCRSEVFGETPQPAGTLLNVSQLAWPGMMIEVDATAVTAK